MAANSRKSGKSTNVPPPVSKFNEDVRANEILKYFNKSKDTNRMEITDIFNQSTSPSSIPNMKGKGSKSANGGK